MPEASVEISSPIERATAAAARMGCWNVPNMRLSPAATPAAVPSHAAIENDCWLVEGDGSKSFLRVPCADMLPFLDPGAAHSALAIAAKLGITPASLAFDPESGAVALPWLGDGWRSAYVDDLPQGSSREALIALKRRLHSGPCFPLDRTVFDRIDDLKQIGDRIGVNWSDDDQSLTEHAELIMMGFKAAGYDLRPCHGDGHASNVMLGPGGKIAIVDFDLASNNDPHHDLAALLLDLEPWDDGIAAGIETYCGAFDPKVFDRVRLHMVLDDIMWGRLTLVAAHVSPRRHIEFQKYAELRLLRGRYHLHIWPVDEMLRRI